MKSISIQIRAVSLLFAMILPFFTPVRAQLVGETKPEQVLYDPIVATLDSLVHLTYIQRLTPESKLPVNEHFNPYDVPVYSDEVYKSRFEKLQSPIPFTFNRHVREYINIYAVKKRGLTERVMGLANLYFPLYEQILDKEGLPLEFKYLSIVESALNPTAVSRVGATGLWQFMLQTGKLYDLKVTSYIDERRDPVKSTQAACQYFKDMYAIYNDWLLVVAAYNCGPGNVNRAIARSGGKKTFWEIMPYLPAETRGYVPAFVAVTYVMSYAAEHNLTAVPPVISYFDADTVMVDQKITLKAVSDAINVPIDLLSYLNPLYKRGVIPDAEEQMVLRLPVNKVSAYMANISNIYKPVEKPLYVSSDTELPVQKIRREHVVRSGENLSVIADRYNCTVSDLKRWNRLKSNNLAIGKRLLVRAPEHTKAASLATSKKSNTKQSGDAKYDYHIVEAGDTLWEIARRYEGMTVEQLKQINSLRSNDLKVGTKLKVIRS